MFTNTINKKFSNAKNENRENRFLYIIKRVSLQHFYVQIYKKFNDWKKKLKHKTYNKYKIIIYK